MVTGYLHRDYAESLAEFGEPLLLPKSEGWILKRRIPDFPAFDAMGCYPLFACSDWSRLDSDLDELKADLVSLTLVADPFGNHDVEGLRRCFRDLVIPYKEHFVVDLSLPLPPLRRPAIATMRAKRCGTSLWRSAPRRPK